MKEKIERFLDRFPKNEIRWIEAPDEIHVFADRMRESTRKAFYKRFEGWFEPRIEKF